MANKLAQSTSPYLQQHAHNPVDWQEWGPEALALAREQDRPILLSVGYSACHWCHVMAHESFEDPAVAAVMNEHFVNIKVDREERPDLDQIYQSAHAMLTQRSGGWPLTMFLTPDTTPFFGGTYFPATARYGLPGFGDLLIRVAGYYRERRQDIREQNRELLAALNRREASVPAGDSLHDGPIDAARDHYLQTFDRRRGGFGTAPKFPHPEMIEFCLRRYAAEGDRDARAAACTTLARMCEGGIYDQLGGGFARYSVDAEWAIPHFEKMLYDNGPLLRLLADAWRVSGDEAERALFARCAAGTAEWVMREMQSPAGGYYSTLDADSEGHEGKFYVWHRDEVKALLADDEWRVAAPHFGLDRAPNFEGSAWNLVVARPLAELAPSLGLAVADAARILDQAKAKLAAARAGRIRPGRDEKILTSWNALMIEGMVQAGRAFGRPEWIDSARRALDFVRRHLWKDGRLLATHKDGRSHLNAYLDDHAFLLKALLAMLEARFSPQDLRFARDLADLLLTHFEDAGAGGFFFTSHDHEALIQRPKPAFDNATPSGNGVAVLALQRLAHLTGDLRYEASARRALAAFFPGMAEYPAGHGTLLMALEEALVPPRMLLVTGAADEAEAFRGGLADLYLPDLMTLAPGGHADLPSPLTRPPGDGVNAWLCQGVTCLPAIRSLDELRHTLKAPIVRPAP